jgi:hypothetical protein
VRAARLDHRALDQGQHPLRMVAEHLAGRGEPDRALGAVDEEEAELFLQSLDLAAQRGLSDAQPACGAPFPSAATASK